MAPSTAPSKRNALRDHASLLRHLHRVSTSSISTGLLSPTARPPSSPTSPLSPVPPSSTFTLFPLQPSTLPAEPQPFTLEDDILACADRLARDLDAKKQPALDESSRRRKRRRLEGLHKEHARPLVVSTVCVLEGTLEELAARTKKSSWKLDRKSKRERREKVSGWEEVLLAMGSLQGLDDRLVSGPWFGVRSMTKSLVLELEELRSGRVLDLRGSTAQAILRGPCLVSRVTHCR